MTSRPLTGRSAKIVEEAADAVVKMLWTELVRLNGEIDQLRAEVSEQRVAVRRVLRDPSGNMESILEAPA